MPYRVSFFLSSRCYGLEDLRAVVASFLEGQGFDVHRSEESGFPHHPGMPPYVSCLRTLESCHIAVVVIDKSYGTVFEDWGDYPEYSGKAPVHAEIEHALKHCKRTWIFVRASTEAHYQTWRKNKDGFDLGPAHPDIKTLRMLHDIKLHPAKPWIRVFDNASVLCKYIQENIQNELFMALQSPQGRRVLAGEADSPPPSWGDAAKAYLDALKQRLSSILANHLDTDERSSRVVPLRPSAESAHTGNSRFVGLPPNLWFSGYILELESVGALDPLEFPDDFFDHSSHRTGLPIERERFVALLMRSVALPIGDMSRDSGTPPFPDIDPESPFASHIYRAHEAGILGANEKFGVGEAVSRSNAAMMAALLLVGESMPKLEPDHLYDDVGEGSGEWAHIYLLRRLGIMTGDGNRNTFRPNHPLNRVEATKIAWCLRGLLGPRT